MTDQSSIVRFIEDNWLGGQRIPGSFDAIAGPLNNMFDFNQSSNRSRNPRPGDWRSEIRRQRGKPRGETSPKVNPNAQGARVVLRNQSPIRERQVVYVESSVHAPAVFFCTMSHRGSVPLAKRFLMTLQDVRKEFPALQQQTFLDSACVSLAPQRAVEKLRTFLDMAAYCPSGSSTQHHLDMDEMRSQARPQLAKLINADEDDIALVESTTHGLSLVANAIPLERGDRVVICDLEFLEVAVPWMQKREELGIEIDSVQQSRWADPGRGHRGRDRQAHPGDRD